MWSAVSNVPCQRAACDCASQLRKQDRIPNLGVIVRFNLGLSLVVAFTAIFLFALTLVIAQPTFFLTAVLFVIPVVLPIATPILARIISHEQVIITDCRTYVANVIARENGTTQKSENTQY
jgi:hypothetical protein